MTIRYLGFDLLAVVAFAILARLAHQTPDMPFGLSGIAETGWPFLIGALVGWGVLSLLGRRATGSSLSSGGLVWICTLVSGLTIWSIRHAEIPHWSFVLVASVMSALLIEGWRLIANKVQR